jgi:Flp pilus assembly pilin Flp
MNNQITTSVENSQPVRRRSFLRDERGAGLVEYILLAGLVAIGCIIAFRGFGKSVSNTVDKQGAKVEQELSPQ